MNVGDRYRCMQCGGKIALIDHPRVIALNLGLWVHESGLRRLVSNHPAKPPQ